ncbi:MAG: AAA family ATPase [Desulfobulbaceae bacterium]|nr:AAA family ATPase [Desulfobulbaceae bacterium]
MYTSHYGLNNKPFQISSDVAFMWLGEKHKEALATLRYGILDNKGFLLLTGDVGTGKTTLINTLIGSLDNDVIYASVTDPSLEKLDFFNYIGAAFDIGCEFNSKGKFLSSFSKFLNKAYVNNQKVLLIIDEAQLLTQELLEEIRLLSNIVTKDSNPLLNIFLVGQYEFNSLIRRPENRAIAQRITLNYYIEPLTAAETGEYIRHRLKIAGTTEKIFNTSAIKAIYAFSNGFPRKINIICDHCLMSGYAEEKKTITSAIVKESAKDLQIPEDRIGLHDKGDSTAQQDGPLMPVSADQLSVSSNQRRPSTQLFQFSKAMKAPFVWSVGGLLFIVFASIFFSFLFLYYTNTTYKEAASYLTSIQEQIGISRLESSGKNIPPSSQSKPVVIESNKPPKPLPAPGATLPASTTVSVPETEQISTTKVVLNEKVEDSNGLPQSVAADTQAVLPGQTIRAAAEVEEVGNEPLIAEPLNVQPVSIAEDTATHLSDKPAEETVVPLPEEMLVIRFKYDSNLFSVADIERMKEFARVLKFHPEVTVNISGYTDSTGDAVYNKKLSEFRANMVKSFLMGQDLPPEQMTAQGFGNKNPVDTNGTESGRMMNRRVEISVVVKS